MQRKQRADDRMAEGVAPHSIASDRNGFISQTLAHDIHKHGRNVSPRNVLPVTLSH